jgi:pyridoxine 5-phosphate synthase
MTRLSVNLNKVALLRNSRHTGVPGLHEFARIAVESGAGGITVHPRPDERHIRRNDVPALAMLMQPRRPTLELNVEGYPDARLLDIAAEVRPEQCTLVPDAPSAFTSEKGWDLTADQMQLLRPVIASLRALRSRVILFIDPDPTVLARVIEVGAQGIEIYTGGYAAAFRAGSPDALLRACAATAERAAALGLVVNIGHDLNLDNLPPLAAALPAVAEASIGHELTADALVMGFAGAVRAYRAALNRATAT